MTLEEAIKILRQHNVTGASVLRITRGQALEKDLLSQVLDSCEQLISEKAEYKRLLKAAMGDMEILYETGKDEGCLGIEFKWRYANEAENLLSDEK